MASLFDKRLSLAMSILAAKGLLNDNAMPIGWKFIRRSGLKVPPLYFWGFKTTWIAYTLLFSFGFSVFEYSRLRWPPPSGDALMATDSRRSTGVRLVRGGAWRVFPASVRPAMWLDLNPSA